MKTHKIKLNRKYCGAVHTRAKSFEVRYNDRDYKVGDYVEFLPVDDDGNRFRHPVQDYAYLVVYVHEGLGMQPGYVVLGIRWTGKYSEEAHKDKVW